MERCGGGARSRGSASCGDVRSSCASWSSCDVWSMSDADASTSWSCASWSRSGDDDASWWSSSCDCASDEGGASWSSWSCDDASAAGCASWWCASSRCDRRGYAWSSCGFAQGARCHGASWSSCDVTYAMDDGARCDGRQRDAWSCGDAWSSCCAMSRKNCAKRTKISSCCSSSCSSACANARRPCGTSRSCASAERLPLESRVLAWPGKPARMLRREEVLFGFACSSVASLS